MAVAGDLEEARTTSQPLPQSEEHAARLEKAVPEGRQLHASVYILSWIFFSNVTILFNKWLIDTAGFRYPIILTTWHLVFATIATQLLARTTSLLDSRHAITLSRGFYLRTILPIGVLYSGSLVCSNVVYLYLSVAFIQMLKSTGPVAVLIASWAWGVATPNLSTLGNVLLIMCGVAIASAGEIEFSWIGFVFQLGGTIFEAVRLVMIQVMLGGEGIRMDPLVGLYYFAPVCAVMNIFVVAVTEAPTFQWDDLAKTGYGMLLLNASVAFLLNVVSVFLIGKTSGLVMALSGILKSILLVGTSVLIWNTHISLLQILGYALALVGLVLYSVGYEQILAGVHNAKAWLTSVWNSENPDNGGKVSIKVRRAFIIGIIGFIMTVIAVSLWHISGDGLVQMTNSMFGSK
ncbi:triose-phosphate transporter family-domain-containing protein [Ilyonectria robusta]|uniref:triose-phosphate transporter family-domain-containing protein n=1 Tax=Ilyonectria robusta TaxID=1079257 RepID=UPI001E8EE650|nr:triose-phosphate transporter family-domain-containing protein [Ilyonectria robusta]KAH8733658.1 triose-phosphate transporter family-domain-containing protein [Ilyonectria robusta]